MGASLNCLISRLRRQPHARQNCREQFWTAQLARRAEGMKPGAILMYPDIHCGSRLWRPASLYRLHPHSRARGTSLHAQKNPNLLESP